MELPFEHVHTVNKNLGYNKSIRINNYLTKYIRNITSRTKHIFSGNHRVLQIDRGRFKTTTRADSIGKEER